MDFAGRKIDLEIITGRRFLFFIVVIARLLKEMEIEEETNQGS